VTLGNGLQEVVQHWRKQVRCRRCWRAITYFNSVTSVKTVNACTCWRTAGQNHKQVWVISRLMDTHVKESVESI
jgi:hypothetical protein